MKYIKSFETEAAYEAGKGDLSTPYVAYTKDDEQVHYVRKLEDLYDIVGTLVPGTESFNFKINKSTTITPTIIGNRFVYNWTGSTITSLENAFKDKTALVSVDKFDVPVAASASTYQFAFDCSNLTTPFFFDGQTSIYGRAFIGCTSLTGSLTIPDSVTSIGDTAFYGCSGFNGALTIPDSVTSIGNSAFSGCSGFNGSLIIPDSVTTIGSSTFTNCIGFNDSLTIGNSVTSIGGSAFRGCSSLTSVTIGNSVTSIGGSAFYGCSGLTSVTIPNSVTSIGVQSFYICSSLTSVTIGNSVTTIGDSAFNGCSRLDSITCLATTPPTLVNIDALNRTNNCPIYVPAASVADYQAASGWNTYASRIAAIP